MASVWRRACVCVFVDFVHRLQVASKQVMRYRESSDWCWRGWSQCYSGIIWIALLWNIACDLSMWTKFCNVHFQHTVYHLDDVSFSFTFCWLERMRWIYTIAITSSGFYFEPKRMTTKLTRKKIPIEQKKTRNFQSFNRFSFFASKRQAKRKIDLRSFYNFQWEFSFTFCHHLTSLTVWHRIQYGYAVGIFSMVV